MNIDRDSEKKNRGKFAFKGALRWRPAAMKDAIDIRRNREFQGVILLLYIFALHICTAFVDQ